MLELKPIMTIDEEMLKKPLSTDPRVPASINDPNKFWFWKEVLKADDYVLESVKEGYVFPFLEIPPPSFKKKNQSVLQPAAFMNVELIRLEALGVIERVYERPYIVLPISVVHSGKWRLVINASWGAEPLFRRTTG